MDYIKWIADQVPGWNTKGARQYTIDKRAELVTNITDQPTVWGTPIPFTGGQVRVQGMKLWASAFARVTTRTGVDHFGNSGWFQGDIPGSRNLLYSDWSTDIFTDTKIQYDVAFSFGYNILPQYGRVLSRLWINGVLAYDLAGNDVSRLQFEFHRGTPSGEQSPRMIEDMGEDKAPFFPDQTYLVLKGMKLEDYGNAPIQSVSAEFVVRASGGGEYTVHAPINTAVDIRLNYIDWDNRVGYAWGYDSNTAADDQFGTIIKYDIDSYAVLSRTRVTYTAGGDSTNARPWSSIVWLPQSKIVFFPRDVPTNGADSFAMNVETATIFARITPSFPGYEDQFTFSNWSDGIALRESESGADVLVRSIGTSNIIFVYRVSTSGITGITRYRGALGDLTIDRMFSDRDGNAFYVAMHSNPSLRGIYRLTGTGYTRMRDVPAEIVTEGFYDLGVYGGSLYWFTLNRVIRETFTGQRIYNTPYPSGVGTISALAFRKFERAELGGGTLGWQVQRTVTSRVAVLELTSGGISSYDSSGIIDDQQYWDSYLGRFLGAPIGTTQNVTTFTPNLAQGGTIKLRDFITGLYAYSGTRDISRLQYVDINDDVLGGMLVEQTAVEEVVKNICTLFRINRIDRADKTVFYRNVPLSGTVTPELALTIDDLSPIDSDGGDISEQPDLQVKLKINRSSPQSVPDKIELTFIDPDAEYMANTISWNRPGATGDSNSLSVKVPLVLTKDQALVIVQGVYVDSVDFSNEYEFRLPPRYSYVESGDIIAIAHGKKSVVDGEIVREFTDVVQILEDTLNADGSVSCLARGVTLQAGASFLLPTIDEDSPTQAFGSRKNTRVLLIDSTAATILDDTWRQGFYSQYMVLYPQFNQGWDGGYVARYNGSTWETLYGVLGDQELNLYRGGNPLTNKRWITDEDTLTLSTVFGTWDEENNATDEELSLDPSRNLAFYGTDGRWELIQFRSIVDGVMSGIRRGMRGTEIHCGTHQPGDWVVVVKGYVLLEQRQFTSNMSDRYRAVSNGQLFEAAPATGFTARGNSARPWAVTGLKATPAGSDVALSWRRRDRLFSQLGESVGIAEATEAYELEVYASATAEEPLREVTGLTVPTWTYTAADMATDGTTGAATLYVMVYQMSADVGRGYAERVVVNVG